MESGCPAAIAWPGRRTLVIGGGCRRQAEYQEKSMNMSKNIDY
jgi:hypothetical protein